MKILTLGGNVLIPMHDGQPIQLVNAADVTRFLCSAVERQLTGVVNVAGPPTAARTLVDTVLSRVGRAISPNWVGEESALTNEVRRWIQVPLWLPASSPELALMSVNNSRATSAGLIHQRLGESTADCLDWQTLRRGWSQRSLGRARDQQLLQQWRR